MLRLEDDWVWDSWIADDGERYHIFYLKAPRSLRDPALRHECATIGHATSDDLTTWTVEPDALLPAPDSWDDLALWTGSVARGDDGVWRLFYTAISGRGHGARDQRIGIAESGDLFHWRRVGSAPAVEADPRWYTTLDGTGPASETWRDPFVFRDPAGDGWHMFVTARARGAGRLDDGVIAHATSDDMLTWAVHPPITEPAGFGQIEVTQLRRIGDRWVLVFTCGTEEQAAWRIERDGLFSTWAVIGDDPLGPWDIAAARPFTAEPALFAAPLVQQRDGRWALVGFRNLEQQGRSVLEILDPIPVRIDGDRLVAAT